MVKYQIYPNLRFNPLLVQLPGETCRLLLHKSHDGVSIHSWSSYQEKPEKTGKLIEGGGFQSTPGLVTRRNEKTLLNPLKKVEFQSTPGLVTRRNTNLSSGEQRRTLVSIHSWSSYQEKLSTSTGDTGAVVFQSTPGLVTRRNLMVMWLTSGASPFQSTPGLVTRRNPIIASKGIL